MSEHRQALPKNFALNENYIITSVLGQGGFGITYKAHDNALDAPVAIKEYFPDSLAMRDGGRTVHAQSSRKDADYEKGRQRFMREMRSLNQFRHPNILRVRSVFTANNTAYAVLDFEQGETLSDWVRQLSDPPLQERLDELATSLLAALETVHNGKIMHRDISPGNIIVRPDGSPVLIDFGSARQFTPESTQTTSIIVTHGFSPPEQYRSNAVDRQGPPSDIYSMGATLYYLVTGSLLPRSEERESALQTSSPDPLQPARKKALRKDYRPEFLEAIDWALKLKEADRPQTVAEWRSKLLAKSAPARSLAEQLPPPVPLLPNGPAKSLDVLRVLVAIVLMTAAAYLGISAWRMMSDVAITSAPPDRPSVSASNGSSFGNEDDTAWATARNLDRLSSYQDYLRRFPSGRHAADAQKRIAELEAASAPPPPAPSPPPAVAKDFLLLPHATIEGGDILSSGWPRMDRPDCQQACRDEPQCIAYTHDAWSGYCFLKSSAPYMRIEPKYESGIVSGRSKPASWPTPLHMKRRPNKTFLDSPDSTIKASSFDKCAEACAKTSGCWYVQYQHAGGQSCGLFGDASEYIDGIGSDVGVKWQAMN